MTDDFRAVATRIAQKIEDGNEQLPRLFRQSRRWWDDYLRLLTKRDDKARAGEDTETYNSVLLQRDQELTQLEAKIARILAKIEPKDDAPIPPPPRRRERAEDTSPRLFS